MPRQAPSIPGEAWVREKIAPNATEITISDKILSVVRLWAKVKLTKKVTRTEAEMDPVSFKPTSGSHLFRGLILDWPKCMSFRLPTQRWEVIYAVRIVKDVKRTQSNTDYYYDVGGVEKLNQSTIIVGSEVYYEGQDWNHSTNGVIRWMEPQDPSSPEYDPTKPIPRNPESGSFYKLNFIIHERKIGFFVDRTVTLPDAEYLVSVKGSVVYGTTTEDYDYTPGIGQEIVAYGSAIRPESMVILDDEGKYTFTGESWRPLEEGDDYRLTDDGKVKLLVELVPNSEYFLEYKYALRPSVN